MAEEIGFTQESIRAFICSQGSKVEYQTLIKHFKRALAHQNAKIAFKDYVNELAFVAQEGKTKYLLLRPKYSPDFKGVHVTSFDQKDEDIVADAKSNCNEDYKQFQNMFSTSEDLCPPQPPPRRKSIRVDDKLRSLSDIDTKETQESDSKSVARQNQKLQEIHELTVKSVGRVKEHAQKLNRMASESDLKPPMPAVPEPQKKTKGKENTVKDHKEEDTDSGSLQPLDALRRKWMITASTCDYNELLQLLREDSDLASFKGGHTPLHLAAMFGHKNVVELLTHVYHANPNIRDYSGKLAHQYLQQIEERKMSTSKANIERCNDNHTSGSNKSSEESSHSFIRIGSLNSKMRRTAAVLSSITSWGSADSLSDFSHSKHLMPHPRILLKKKRNKKALSTPPIILQPAGDIDADQISSKS
ncbi:ankyrin repeat domain-containing protein SOWAHB-like isoform X2 [Leptotrombidium deliense]|uniref:Ankyrin repeat domain-containing protein SOWAHB-like isoform X2 n=1 Tax=Leptotrombidium deliense TaxID=299467 RepID=A0A443SUG0_9ACAR|nr:ankyrin repeat domain-containing protein SOWAHB-like isoform X2 [Leptotrombidium deliense]